MPPTVPEGSTANSPLAPSVEKAYYRKCIELKRRLNDIEAANDEAKLRRVRLDRAIQKMRLERAFLLEQLMARMDSDFEGSEGSAEEQPPPDRPHRDKRRKHASSTARQPAPPSTSRSAQARQPSPTPASPTAQTNNRDSARERDVSTGDADQPRATNGVSAEEQMDIDQDQKTGGAADESSAGPEVQEEVNGQRQVEAGG